MWGLWVAVSIAGLIIIFFILLLVPVDLVVRLDLQGGRTLHMEVIWFFGLITRKIKTAGREVEAKRKRPAARRFHIRMLIEILKTRGIIRRFVRFLKNIFRQLSFKYLEAEMTVGVGDPAATGLLFGLIAPVTQFINTFGARRISIQPDFGSDAVFEGYLQGALTLRPVKLVIPAVQFIFSRPARKLSIKLLMRRWKSRK